MDKRKVLAVDDDESFLKVLSYQVREMGFEVLPFSSPKEALDHLQQGQSPDLVVTDLRMPEMDGLVLLDQIADLKPNLPVIVLTAHGNIDVAVEATRKGAFEFLTKPFEKEELEQAIRNALKFAIMEETCRPGTTKKED